MRESLPERPGETRLTVEGAHRAIGAWVRVVPGERTAIICKATGTSLLVRYTGNTNRKGQDSHYVWASLDGVRLVDGVVTAGNPDWLHAAVEQARRGRGYSMDLSGVVSRMLHPGELELEVDPQAIYQVYRRERELLEDGNGDLLPHDRERLERWFEGFAAFEAHYVEARALWRELDKRTVPGRHA